MADSTQCGEPPSRRGGTDRIKSDMAVIPIPEGMGAEAALAGLPDAIQLHTAEWIEYLDLGHRCGVALSCYKQGIGDLIDISEVSDKPDASGQDSKGNTKGHRTGQRRSKGTPPCRAKTWPQGE